MNQVKSKARVADHGEVFTHEREVNAILDLVKQEIERIDSRFLEPVLFKKVSGLTVKDFELLVSLGVFNSSLMNDAIYKFKRYEDSSLEYIGINKHEGEDVGLWDTTISSDEYEEIFAAN